MQWNYCACVWKAGFPLIDSAAHQVVVRARINVWLGWYDRDAVLETRGRDGLLLWPCQRARDIDLCWVRNPMIVCDVRKFAKHCTELALDMASAENNYAS